MSDSSAAEVFDLVDEFDVTAGITTRAAVHGNPALIHRVAHVLVFNDAGELYLQKRSSTKDVQPGRWDTSVGGHVDSGESYERAAAREMREELGIQGATLCFVHKYLHRNGYESEYVCTYQVIWNAPIAPDPVEIDEGRFWSIGEIFPRLESGIFTPNFVDELNRYFSDPAGARARAL
ncbi:MAG TPA: NUDIX domain-containing protein [Spirochaetia bacterium]|nr:NUDIX domain-containing protein [Spirochaetia bacterium]